MPLFLNYQISNNIHILVWKIEEEDEDLTNRIKLHQEEKQKYDRLQHPDKKREFLALRACLHHHFGENPAVSYTSNGKPFLAGGPQISFSHTRGFAAVIISESLAAGIDIEYHRNSIQRIAHRFMREEESATIEDQNNSSHILAYWGCKESIVKIEGDRRLNFKEQIRIKPFMFGNYCHTTGLLLRNDNSRSSYSLYFRRINDLHLTWGWKR